MMRVILLGCGLAQIFMSIAWAVEMPAKVNQGKYYKTLEGMPVPSSIPAVGALRGFIQTTEGKPLAGADVFFFNVASGPSPAPKKYWRFFDEIAKLDDKGGFFVELPPGRYSIGAVQRKVTTTILAPPSDGDIFYYENKIYEVFPALQNNLEKIIGAKPFTRKNITNGESITAIEGKVFDAAGKPVENAIVASYTDSKVNGRPLFGSQLTDKDGVYFLRVAGAGTYYLRVREVYGVGPVEGAYMLAYGGNNPKAVKVKDGEVVKGIDLTGDRFLRPMPK